MHSTPKKVKEIEVFGRVVLTHVRVSHARTIGRRASTQSRKANQADLTIITLPPRQRQSPRRFYLRRSKEARPDSAEAGTPCQRIRDRKDQTSNHGRGKKSRPPHLSPLLNSAHTQLSGRNLGAHPKMGTQSDNDNQHLGFGWIGRCP